MYSVYCLNTNKTHTTEDSIMSMIRDVRYGLDQQAMYTEGRVVLINDTTWIALLKEVEPYIGYAEANKRSIDYKPLEFMGIHCIHVSDEWRPF